MYMRVCVTYVYVYVRMYMCTYTCVPYGLVRRQYTYREGPPELGAPENLTFRWNQAYLVQNCAKNAIQTRKFWEKCIADYFF